MSLKSIASVLICLVTASVVYSQETVAEVDFDNSEAKYISSYVFGGYGPADGSAAQVIGDQLSCTQLEDESNGSSAELAEAEKQLAEAKGRFTSQHPKVMRLQETVKDLSANRCAKLVFDSSVAKVPSDATYDYAGAGLGVTFDMTGKSFDSQSLASYTISFDAKVTGTQPLMQSKLSLKFVTDDGDDEDDFDDLLVQLTRGQDDGTDTFEINSEYQTFSFNLDSLLESDGKVAELKDAKLTGVNVNVQAQGTLSDFGTDKDNVLYVDNVRLIKK